ncbi:MAG: DUF971 domain-containing protein [Myxococcales bacterium FL481]|nr:MAG: DUF971 domain-containing protein [Myxococcales bacterium FL481]
MTVPIEVVWDRARSELRLAWSTGADTVLDGAYLRRWCPCAACQGHSGHVRFLSALADTQITGVAEVGAYALNLTFADGHDSGIYSWTWLRRLDPSGTLGGPKSGVFVRGSFHPAPT